MDVEVKCCYCGTTFIAKSTVAKWCSKRCKDIAFRTAHGIKVNANTEPYHKECIICGKPFDTFREAVKTCSPECSRERNNSAKRKRYKSQGKEITIKCEICGEAVFTKHPTQKTCLKEGCKKEYALQQHRIRNQRYKDKVKIEKIYYKAVHTVERECTICGSLFYCLDKETRCTCSPECAKKHKNFKHDKRIPKAQRVDKISLKRLYKRDSGKCYLCGGQCDWNDWRTSKNGNQYPGDNYPVKEHVIPIAKGGLDAWDNVRLAHWKCNLDKADGIIEIQPMTKQFAYSQKFSATQAKKTAQYSLDGELIKIWDSTAQIRRELGLNDKHIQSVCRRHKSNTGNAYGFHWEYVS